MLQEKAGELAGKIWQALNETASLTGKELYLGLGWLLREDKVVIVEEEKDIRVSLK